MRKNLKFNQLSSKLDTLYLGDKEDNKTDDITAIRLKLKEGLNKIVETYQDPEYKPNDFSLKNEHKK